MSFTEQSTFKTKQTGSPRQFTSSEQRTVVRGHDALLKMLQETKRTVSLWVTGAGSAVNGLIVGRDRFTVTLEVEIDGKIQHLLFFKSAIESIQFTPKAR